MKSDELFLADLAASHAAVETVARWFRSKGYPVVWNPTRVRPDRAQALAYSDHGDLVVMQTVEVSHRRVDFTSLADYPYPRVLVDTVATYRHKPRRPLAYVLPNESQTHALYVDCSTEPKWWVDRIFNRRSQKWLDTYFCSLDLATVIDLSGCRA